MKLLLLQFGAVMANSRIEVDAERLLSEDDAERSLASTSVCTNKSRIFELGLDMTIVYTHTLSDFSLKLGHSRWETCHLFKCRIGCRAKKNKLYLRILEWEWVSTSETTTTRTTTKAAASKICDNKTEIVNRPPQLKISLGNTFRLAIGIPKSGPCKQGGTKFKCTLKCLSRNGAVQLLLKKEKACDVNNLSFQLWRNKSEMYNTGNATIFHNRIKVACRYNSNIYTRLQCKDGQVLPNYDCPESPQRKNAVLGTYTCPSAEQVSGDDNLDFEFGCTHMDTVHREFRCKYPNPDGTYNYNMMLGQEEDDVEDDGWGINDWWEQPKKWIARKTDFCPRE